MTTTISLVDAPSNLGLAPPAPGKDPGVRRMAQTLRQLGVQERLGALNGGEVSPPRYSPERDAATGIRNVFAIAEYSSALGRAVGAQLDAGRFPVVLGGDCSILLGSLLALHRRGRYALLFLDGHHDLQTPHVSRTGGAAGMDLALAVGIGPPVLAALGGPAPLVHPADVFMLGVRDDPAYYTGDDVRQAREAMHVHYLDELRRTGMAATGQAIATQIARSGVTGAWIHIDVDVLDDAVMPAVDSRQAGGLSYDELHALLRPVLDSGRVAGIHLTIYDPDLDPDHRAGQLLVDNLGRLLAR
jgi:arginase